jgi:hypothetical protein
MIDQDELHDANHIQNGRSFPNASSGGLGLTLANHHQRIAAVERVALGSAVAETRPDVAQIAALADRLATKRTETLPEWRPAIDDYKSHMTPPTGEAIDRIGSIRQTRHSRASHIQHCRLLLRSSAAPGTWV